MNDEVAQALVQLCAVLVREARLADHLLLVVCQTVNSDFLVVEVEGGEALAQFFIHLISFE